MRVMLSTTAGTSSSGSGGRQRTWFQLRRSAITTAWSTPCRRRCSVREAGDGKDRGSTTFLAALLLTAGCRPGQAPPSPAVIGTAAPAWEAVEVRFV
jgi:hypothetical protein